MKPLIMVAGFLWLMALQVHAAATSAQMPRDVLDALRGEIVGDDVPKLLKILHEVVDFDNECDAASKIVVSYREHEAHLFLMLDGKACAVVTGPADGVRRMLLDVQGRPI